MAGEPAKVRGTSVEHKKGADRQGEEQVMEMRMSKRINSKKWALIFLLTVLTLVGIPATAKEAQAANKVTVTFLSFNGKTNAEFQSLSRTVEAGSVLTLPNLPAAQNHRAMGWSYAKRSVTANFSQGQPIVVNQNLTLYSAYQKLYPCELAFTSNKGKSKSKIFTSLNLYGNPGDVVSLPQPPYVKGYKAIGWTTKKGKMDPLYLAGDSFTITKKLQYIYGVYVKEGQELVTFYVHKLGGEVMGTAHLVKGGYVKLPALRNTAKWAMLGYSDQPMQTSNPKYLPGEKFRIYEDTHYYVVASKRSKESNLSASQVSGNLNAARQKFQRVIFVGDSRIWRMQLTLQTQFGASSMDGVSFIAAGSQGLDWLQNQGYSLLINEINTWNMGGTGRTAVIFNLGINDLSNIDNYVAYMKALEPTLKSKNCQLYYMSLNPANSKVLRQNGAYARDEAVVRAFNSQLKNSLPGYGYIDTYSYLMNNGFSYDGGSYDGNVYTDSGVDDGLHYSTRTYKRIYDFALNYIASH